MIDINLHPNCKKIWIIFFIQKATTLPVLVLQVSRAVCFRKIWFKNPVAARRSLLSKEITINSMKANAEKTAEKPSRTVSNVQSASVTIPPKATQPTAPQPVLIHRLPKKFSKQAA